MAGTTGLLLALLAVYAVSKSLSLTAASCGIQKTSVIEDPEEGLVIKKEFPWVVSLQDSHHTHLAFGSVLSEFWILSVASAFQHRKYAVAVVGIANMDAKVFSHEEYPVDTIITHEDFDNTTMTNDLALLRTETALKFTSLVQSICFLSRNLHMQLALHNCWVAGWNPTFATGNQMTMSILRKISVKDLDQCPLPKFQKTGCGAHVAEETEEVCLGDPGNPLMCQLQQSGLWVLKGILSHGGERCPGLFLYAMVPEYSDWITSKTQMTSLPLSALYHWKNLAPFYSYSPQASSTMMTTTKKTDSSLDQVTGTQTQSKEQESTTPTPSSPGNSARESKDFKREGVTEPMVNSSLGVPLPEYYDYYFGHSSEGKPRSGQDRLHAPREMILSSLVLSFVMVRSPGASPPGCGVSSGC